MGATSVVTTVDSPEVDVDRQTATTSARRDYRSLRARSSGDTSPNASVTDVKPDKHKFKLPPIDQRPRICPPLHEMSAAETAFLESNKPQRRAEAATVNNSDEQHMMPETSNSTAFQTSQSSAATAQKKLANCLLIPAFERPATYWASSKQSKWTAQQRSKYANSPWSTSKDSEDVAYKAETPSKRKATSSPERTGSEDKRTQTKLSPGSTTSKLPTSNYHKSWLRQSAEPDSEHSSIASKASDDDILVNPEEATPLTSFAPSKASTNSADSKTQEQCEEQPETAKIQAFAATTTSTANNDGIPSWFKPCSASDVRAAPYLMNDTPSNPHLTQEWAETKADMWDPEIDSPNSYNLMRNKQLNTFLQRRKISMEEWEKPFLEDDEIVVDTQNRCKPKKKVERKWEEYFSKMGARWSVVPINEGNGMEKNERGWTKDGKVRLS